VWACPVCAARITEKRAEELRAALAKNTELGGSAGFATFTVSHKHEDSLQTVLEGFLASFRYLTSKPSYKRLRARWGVRGSVRVLEVTYGRNGWHVHAHVLFFFEGKHDAGDVVGFEAELFPLWESAAARHSLTMSRERGVQVVLAYGTVEDYVAKYGHGPRWEVPREMTKGHIKRGRSVDGLKHLTPWEMLAFAAAGDVRCGARFRECVEHFDGKAQLGWSPGLRASLGLDGDPPESDHALATAGEKDDDPAGEIQRDHWPSVRVNGGRARLLQLVEEDGGDFGRAAAFVAARVAARPAVARRNLDLLPPEIAAALPAMHAEQTARNCWRGAAPSLSAGEV
jgi:hypothetical protein